MKLAYVHLDVAINIGKGARYVFNEEDAPGMRYDTATNSLVIGDQGVTWGHVIEWRRLNLELVCELCGAEFKAEQGRTMHRKSCKGKKEAQ